MQEYQTVQTDYCRAVQVQTPKDRPEIEPDPDGFGYRVQCYSPGYGFYWKPIRKGDFILYHSEAFIRRHGPDTRVRGVLPADEFKERWTARKPEAEGTVTQTVLTLVRGAVERQILPDETCGFVMPVAQAREFLAEHGVVV